VTSVPTTRSSILPRPAGRVRRRVGVAATSVVAVSTFGLLAGLTGTAQAATAPGLGTAGTFSVLAGSAITNTGPTTVIGDIGSSGSIDGGITQPPGSNTYGAGTVTTDAETAMSNAMGLAEGASPNTPVVAGKLGDLDLFAGVYNSGSSSLDLTGTLTLDGGGSYDSVFIFQATSSLITAGSSTVRLVNGAQACNVFWQVKSSATLGGSSTFRGTILAQTAITLGNLATVEGRVLAKTAAVSLNANTITRPDTCLTGSAPITTTTRATANTPTPTPTTAAPAATPAAASAPATASGSAGTTGRPTYGQVRRVPVGAVDTGDGSMAEELYRSSAR
jgi:hypothetical protein